MKRPFQIAAAVILSLLFAAPPDSSAAPRRAPFWACSDGAGNVQLFWLPKEGNWPEGGFRLERIVRKRSTVVARSLLPGQDAEAMSAIEPADATDIRILAEKIRYGSMTDEERNDSISVMGRNAALYMMYGRALGVRYVDRVKKGGNLVYALTALDADGNPVESVYSNEVNPMKRTAKPEPPVGLKAEVLAGGVALFWSDPPAGSGSPILAYRIGRAGARGKVQTLTDRPVVLKRHLKGGEPEFLDAEPRRDTTYYQVQSVDLFARESVAVKVKVEAEKLLAFVPRKLETAPLPVLPPPPPAPVVIESLLQQEEEARIAMERKAEEKPPPPAPPREKGPAAPSSAPSSAPPSAPPSRPPEPAHAAVAAAASPVKPTGSAELAPVLAPGAESGRTPEEEARIASYRKMAEEGRSVVEQTESEPSAARQESAAPAPPPPAPPAPAEPPRTPEEEARIAIYRKMAEEQYETPVPRKKEPERAPAPGPEPPAPPPSSDSDRTPEEEARIALYRKMAGQSPDVLLPPAPVLVAIRMREQAVAIDIAPGGPSCPDCKFLVFRSETPEDAGAAVGAPLPPETRRWTDPGAKPGNGYWYRAFAVDKNGRISEPSAPVSIRVPDR